MKIRKVIDALERFAPLPLQESYDNAGLQVGLTEAEVSGVLLCLDVTEAVVDDAVAKGCNMIVAHHPLIFHRLACITDADYVQRTVMKAIENRVCIVAMHTNLDNAQGGVNYKMAEKLGLQNVRFLGEQRSYTWHDDGQQSYEYASGTVGELPEELSAEEFIAHVKCVFGCKCVMTNELLRRKIKTVAMCGGAGAFMVADALRAKADAFITGEMHYHEYFGHEQEIQIAVTGHYESEQYTQEMLREVIEKSCEGVKCEITAVNTNPIKYL